MRSRFSPKRCYRQIRYSVISKRIQNEQINQKNSNSLNPEVCHIDFEKQSTINYKNQLRVERLKKLIHSSNKLNRTHDIKSIQQEKLPALYSRKTIAELSNVYLDGFHTMLNYKSQQPLEIDRQCRVALPNVTDYQGSRYTALDSLGLSIDDVQCELKIVHTEWESMRQQLKQFSNSYKQMKERMQKELNMELEKGRQRLGCIWKILRKNRVEQQEIKMNFRESLKELEIFVEPFISSFEMQHHRLLNLQLEIYSYHPFELSKQNDSQTIYF